MTITPIVSLTDAFRLGEYDGKPLVCFVGGGGKTTSMFTLATELAAQGKRVVTTTTTRLFAAQRNQSPAWCAINDLDTLSRLLDEHGQCLVTTANESWEDGKAQGITAEETEALLARDDVDVVLCEADGSRTRPFKAPADHEPVIPTTTTHVVALVGADVFGKPLNATNVHRPERVVDIAGAKEGDIVTPDIVARVLTHKKGGLFHVPNSAAFIPFLNKAEDVADSMQAEMTARTLLQHDRVKEVVNGSLHQLRHEQSDALRRVGRTAGVVLAAGMAQRFGRTKQLLPWMGQTLVASVADRLLEVCDTVLVVVGHDADAVSEAVAHLPVEVVSNPDYQTGQGSSVATGARELMARHRPFHSETFFAVSDHPFLSSDLLRELQQARHADWIAAPRHGEQRGNPVLFDARLLPDLAALTGEQGGRVLFKRYADKMVWVEVSDPDLLIDIDTPEDFASLSPHE